MPRDLIYGIWLLAMVVFAIMDRRQRAGERRQWQAELRRLQAMTGKDVRQEFAEVVSSNRRAATRFEATCEAVADLQREFAILSDDLFRTLASTPVPQLRQLEQDLIETGATLARVASVVGVPLAEKPLDLDFAHDLLDEPPAR